MGPTVRLLDDTLVDQIAAGEVIERPANLVKELVENAIDAGATAITVSVEDGGRGQVRVIDDGIGMSREDAALSIERHATSKIASFEDLARVATLGFRGEALPSIGSVSRMTLTTRPKDQLEGTRVVVEGGALREVAPAGCPPGTTVEVADLFYNVPARKKFLRARQTETSRIFEVCTRVALSHPELRLAIDSDGRPARQYPPAGSLAERAYQVFGDVALTEIHAERDGIALDAVLAPVELARPGARQLFLLVNDRPITDRALARAVAFAYGNQLPRGHYPRGVVALRVPPEDVDVNAHPQKTEVRFRRAARLVDLVTRMIAAHLPSAPPGDAYWDARLGAAGPVIESGPAPNGRGRSTEVADPPTPYETRPVNGLRLLAQVRDRFLVCEAEEALVVFDRERADGLRRLLLLERALHSDEAARQNLLFPDRLQLDGAADGVLADHHELLEGLGFEWSLLGEGSYVVRAVPAAVADASAAATFAAALEAIRDDSTDSRRAVLRAVSEAAATPNGQSLTEQEAHLIVAALPLSPDAHAPCVVSRIELREVDSNQRHG